MRRMGRPGLLGVAARTAVIAGTATAASGAVARRGQQRAAQQEAAQQQVQQAPAPEPAAAGGENSMIEELKQLAELKDQGILTDEEFQAQKAKVLAG